MTNLDVQVFESTNRFGGRLWSRVIDYACPTIVGEMGGMRLRVGVDKLTLLITSKLGIELVPFNVRARAAPYTPALRAPVRPPSAPERPHCAPHLHPTPPHATPPQFNDGPPLAPTKDEPNATFVLRGVRLLRREFNALTMEEARRVLPVYDLTVPDHVCSPTMLLTNCLAGMIAALVALDAPVLVDPCDTPANLAAVGGPLTPVLRAPRYSWAGSDLAKALLYPRDMLLLSDESGGYDVLSDLPAQELQGDDWLTHFKNLTLERYVRPSGGMQEIPLALQAAFSTSRESKDLSPGLHLNMQLLSIGDASPASGYKYRLTFALTTTNACSHRTTRVPSQLLRHVYTNRVVLALPKAALDALQLDSSAGGNAATPSQEILDTLESLSGTVYGSPAMKLQVSWNSPSVAPNFFNERMGISAGRNIMSEYGAQLFSWSVPLGRAAAAGVSQRCCHPPRDGAHVWVAAHPQPPTRRYPGVSSFQALPACANLTSVHVYIMGPIRESFWRGLSMPAIENALLCSNVTAPSSSLAALNDNAESADPAILDALDAACQVCYPTTPSLGAAFFGRSYEAVPQRMALQVYQYIAEIMGLSIEDVPPPTSITCVDIGGGRGGGRGGPTTLSCCPPPAATNSTTPSTPLQRCTSGTTSCAGGRSPRLRCSPSLPSKCTSSARRSPAPMATAGSTARSRRWSASSSTRWASRRSLGSRETISAS